MPSGLHAGYQIRSLKFPSSTWPPSEAVRAASCVYVAPARRRSHPGPELASWQLHAALPLGALPTAPGCGRAWTRQILREWGLDRLGGDTELLVSELTTNALQASAPIADAAIGLSLASDCERAVILVWDPAKISSDRG
jgi:hypothetical protein